MLNHNHASADATVVIAHHSSVREIRKAFSEFIHSDAAKPSKNVYGTKYPGRSSLLHFLIYAMLRRQDPRKCCASTPKSRQTFEHAMSMLVTPAKHETWLFGTASVQKILTRDFGHVVTPAQWEASVQWWQTLPR